MTGGGRPGPGALFPTARESAGIVVLALAARLVASALVGFETLRFGDARAYVETARALLLTGSYPDGVEALPVFRAPGYPVFLLATTLGHPELLWLDKVVNAFLGAGAALLVARLASAFGGSRRAALLAGLLAALHPPFLLQAADVQSEPLFIVLFLASALALLSAADTGRPGAALAAGAALGLSVLTRPVGLALAPLLLSPLLDRRHARGRRVVLAAASLAGLLLTVGPWTLRNATRFDAFLPVSDQAGLVTYQGTSEMAVSYYRVETREEFQRWMEATNRDVTHGRIGEIARRAGSNPAERSRAFLAAASEWRREDPVRFLRLTARKALDWLRPWASPWGWSTPVVVASGIWYAGLFGLAIAGMGTSSRRGVVAATLLALALTMAAHVATLVIWRYRIACWDPLLVPWAALGAVALAARAGIARQAAVSASVR